MERYQRSKRKGSLPKVPSCNIMSLHDLRDKVEGILDRYDGVRVDSDILCGIAKDLCTFCQVNKEGAMFGTLRSLLTAIMSPELAKETSYRVVGNLAVINSGENGVIVPTWDGQPEEEWVATSIIDAYRSHTFKGKPTIGLVFRVLNGRPAGHIFHRSFPKRFMPIFAGDVGFGRDKWRTDPRDLCFMVLRTYLLKSQRLEFDDYKATAGDVKLNKMLIRQRKEPCPRKFKHRCSVCPVGRDECLMATREVSMVLKDCVRGHQGWFNPAHENQKLCERCRLKRERRISKLK